MTIDDVPKVEDYVVEMTWTDNFHLYFFPKKWEYPFDYRRWWRSYLTNTVLEPGNFVYVVEGAKGEILAWSALKTSGTPPRDINLDKDSSRERKFLYSPTSFGVGYGFCSLNS
jgi:hypothetical protein